MKMFNLKYQKSWVSEEDQYAKPFQKFHKQHATA